jgi:hypothetical protein
MEDQIANSIYEFSLDIFGSHFLIYSAISISCCTVYVWDGVVFNGIFLIFFSLPKAFTYRLSIFSVNGKVYRDSEKDKAAHKDAVDTTNFSET